MSYKHNEAKIDISNTFHVIWKSKGTGKWGPYDHKNGVEQKGKTIDNHPSQWKHNITLPHSCDEWVIGGIEEAQMLINDLRALITQLKAKDIT